MQKNYTTEILDGIAVTRFAKKPDLLEVKRSMDAVLSKGDCRLRMWVLEDGIDLDSDKIRAIGQYAKEIYPVPSKAAIVAFDDLSYGLSRVHDVFREQEGHETRVFRTEQEAIAWLKEGLT